jgi:Protein of unknown function (DUF2934)
MRTRKTTTGKAKSRVVSKTRRTEKPIELPDGMWEQRGRQEGSAFRDWLDAEEIVMEEIHESRE